MIQIIDKKELGTYYRFKDNGEIIDVHVLDISIKYRKNDNGITSYIGYPCGNGLFQSWTKDENHYPIYRTLEEKLQDPNIYIDRCDDNRYSISEDGKSIINKINEVRE